MNIRIGNPGLTKQFRWLLVALTGLAGSLTVSIAHAQEQSKAAIVIRLSESQVETRCVAFNEETISGVELLRRSGLAFATENQGMGSLVCSIEEQGCPANDCFCECSGGGNCTYWSYWHLRDDGWQYAQVGGSGYQIRNKDVDGWSWGPGSVTEAIPPPDVQFDEICSEGSDFNEGSFERDLTSNFDLLSYLPFVLVVGIVIGMGLLARRRMGR